MSEYQKLRKIGIWMDHTQAHLIEYDDPIITTENVVITTRFKNDGNKNTDQNERMIHNREQQDQAKYYKKLSDKIIEYDMVLLFGPTDAKAELLHLIQADHHFDKIKFEVRSTDKMTENQENAYVKDYFSTYKVEESQN